MQAKTKMSIKKQEKPEKPDRSESQPAGDGELFLKILKSNPKLTINGLDENGDVSFDVPFKQIGITKSDLEVHQHILRTTFFANFVGEFLIRQNIRDFIKILTGMNPNAYANVVNNWDHKSMGLGIKNSEAFRFKFDVGLLQQILTEDVSHLLSKTLVASS